MNKTNKHKKLYRTRRNRIKKTRKYGYRKNGSRKYGSRKNGGNNDNTVQCSMCEKPETKTDTLVPSVCSLQHGQRAHRICQKCWWDPNTGFALETSSHQCPGCVKGLPLLPKEKPITIDLTD